MLDPTDPRAFRALAHRVLDDALDGFARIGDGPAWRAVPEAAKAALDGPVPRLPESLEAVYGEFQASIEPYENGNRHPRFLGWVHGNGTPSGVLAEMLAATLNANVGGREHSAVYVERAVIAWSAEIFGFPPTASGILTSGTSLANLIALLVARAHYAGADVRVDGLCGRQLVGYASRAVHRCVPGAFDIVGLGSAALRLIATDRNHRVDLESLRVAIATDRAANRQPFMVVATAGTVDVGAIDDLAALADLCAAEDLWLHVDGAFGALAILSPQHRHLVRGIERADSLAFDFHKWLHVPYDAGCVLIRDAALHRGAFAHPAAYLAPAPAGTAAGEPWFADYGPELSRRFRALAIWFAFKEHGTQRLGAAIERNCRQAARLAERIAKSDDLVLAAPVALNIVCFRFDDGAQRPDALDALNAAIVVDVQQRGIAVPSTTVVDGRSVIRLNLTNHRVTDADLDRTLDAIRASGRRLARSTSGQHANA
jgi:glutamate/tyrosine decarboxylase-like PLP-dependent enzyme